MQKKRYIIRFETNNTDSFDPNLDLALRDMQIGKQMYGLYYDCEITGLFDGFVVNYSFDAILNTFLHDIMNKESIFAYVFKSDCFEDYVKEFIKELYRQLDYSDESVMMDAFIRTKSGDKWDGFSVRVSMPRTIVSEEAEKSFLALGPDSILTHFSPDQLFKYFLPNLYRTLAETDGLNNEELRIMQKYQIGLH